jgi:hypothetical protein
MPPPTASLCRPRNITQQQMPIHKETLLSQYEHRNYYLEELQINSMYPEQVQSYKYLGSAVNSGNSIEGEIQHRITVGNKAYYANQFLFKSRLVSKK